MRMTANEVEGRIAALVDEAGEWVEAGGWHPVRARLFRTHAAFVAIALGLPVETVIDSALATARELEEETRPESSRHKISEGASPRGNHRQVAGTKKEGNPE